MRRRTRSTARARSRTRRAPNIDINGTRVQITGAPAAGDQFVIESNVGGTGDNRNIQALVDRLRASVFNGDVTLQDGDGRPAHERRRADRGSHESTRRAGARARSRASDRLDSVRGVNLDEEAADMLRFEQLYQAAARDDAVADTLFQTLLSALLR